MKHVEEAPFTFHHRLPVQIRFNDIDMFGHLNNNVYLQFLDMGKYAYFRQFMEGTFGTTPTAPVIANINVDFHNPAHIDDRLEVLTAITVIADASMVMEQRIVGSDGSVKCTARTVMVNINMRSGKSEPVDDQWRATIDSYEGRQVSNPR